MMGFKLAKKKFHFKRIAFLCTLSVLCMVLAFAGCDKSKLREYYKEKSNYDVIHGEIKHIEYSDDRKTLFLDIGNMDHNLKYDFTFKICGKNLPVVQEKGIDSRLKVGDTVNFTTALRYFGDGYSMPIVAITVDGEELLSFEEGYENLMDWLG